MVVTTETGSHKRNKNIVGLDWVHKYFIIIFQTQRDVLY